MRPVCGTGPRGQCVTLECVTLVHVASDTGPCTWLVCDPDPHSLLLQRQASTCVRYLPGSLNMTHAAVIKEGIFKQKPHSGPAYVVIPWHTLLRDPLPLPVARKECNHKKFFFQ